jgi:hypothetical protein
MEPFRLELDDFLVFAFQGDLNRRAVHWRLLNQTAVHRSKNSIVMRLIPKISGRIPSWSSRGLVEQSDSRLRSWQPVCLDASDTSSHQTSEPRAFGTSPKSLSV